MNYPQSVLSIRKYIARKELYPNCVPHPFKHLPTVNTKYSQVFPSMPDYPYLIPSTPKHSSAFISTPKYTLRVSILSHSEGCLIIQNHSQRVALSIPKYP